MSKSDLRISDFLFSFRYARSSFNFVRLDFAADTMHDVKDHTGPLLFDYLTSAMSKAEKKKSKINSCSHNSVEERRVPSKCRFILQLDLHTATYLCGHRKPPSEQH